MNILEDNELLWGDADICEKPTEETAKERSPEMGNNISAYLGKKTSRTDALVERYMKGEDLTAEDAAKFSALQGTALLALPDEETDEHCLMGLIQLAGQMKNVEKEPDAAAVTAEKVLFLATTRTERWQAAEDLMVTASKKGLTMINKSTGKRTLEGLLGQLPDTLGKLRGRINRLPEAGSRSKHAVSLVVLALMVVAMLLVLFHPAISGLFTNDNVYDVAILVGAIATILVFFFVGFWPAVATLVVAALLMAGVEAIMPLALFGKLLVLLVLAVIAAWAFWRARKEGAKLTKDVLRRRAEELEEIWLETELCGRYVEHLAKQVDELLREDKLMQDNREEKAREHHHKIHEYIAQYRDKIRAEMRSVENSIPVA